MMGRIEPQLEQWRLGTVEELQMLKENFERKYGIQSFWMVFPPNGEVVHFSIVRRKKTARMKRFRDLTDCKPVAVFELVTVSSMPDPFDLYILDKEIEQNGKFYITLEKREEYYKVGDILIVVSYPVGKFLKKDYLLLINGQKVSIPKPKLDKILKIRFDDGFWIRQRLEENRKLERILKEAKEIKPDVKYYRLVYIDPEFQKQLEKKQ
jgi:hypothetical protein